MMHSRCGLQITQPTSAVLNAKSQNTSSEPVKFTESLPNKFQQPYCEQTWRAATVGAQKLGAGTIGFDDG